MALSLRTVEDEAEFVSHVRQNMVRFNLPPPFGAGVRQQRGLRVEEGLEPVIVDRGLGPLDPVVVSSPVLACVGGGGDVITFSRAVANGATDVIISRRISTAFLVSHIWMMMNTGNDTTSAMSLKVSSDDDPNGGFDTTGDNILDNNQFPGRIDPGDRTFEVFPNKLFSGGGKFIKFVMFNSTAAFHDFIAAVSIIPVL